MSFLHELEAWPAERVLSLIERAKPEDVDRALSRRSAPCSTSR